MVTLFLHPQEVVSDNAKILILKQITTQRLFDTMVRTLCLIMQRY